MARACTQPACSGLSGGGYCTRDYPSEHHLPTLDALLSLDLKNLIRKEADEKLNERSSPLGFRQFLLTNLKQITELGNGSLT